jgi:hypothetical protein
VPDRHDRKPIAQPAAEQYPTRAAKSIALHGKRNFLGDTAQAMMAGALHRTITSAGISFPRRF